jgi:hypothetical protein
MLGILLHGGDLSGWAWLFILVIVALVGAALLAAFIGVLYLINKRLVAREGGRNSGGLK